MIDRIYQYFVDRKNRQYDKGKLLSSELDTPVISIGNLSAGGAGKTPLIALCSAILTANDIKHAIVGHGYKRSSKLDLLIQQGESFVQKMAGDEAALLSIITDADVGLSSSKKDAAAMLDSKGDYQALLVDDGFQHRQLARDLDILIIDNSTVRHPYLLPRGRLREPISSAQRADAIIFRDIDEVPFIFKPYTQGKLVFFAKTILLDPMSLSIWPKPLEDPSKSDSDKIIAMSGLARNTSFHKSLKKLGKKLLNTIEYKDHHSYSPEDVQSAFATLRKLNADHIAITEKDAVKLKDLDISSEMQDKIFVYPMRLEIAKHSELEKLLLSAIART